MAVWRPRIEGRIRSVLPSAQRAVPGVEPAEPPNPRGAQDHWRTSGAAGAADDRIGSPPDDHINPLFFIDSRLLNPLKNIPKGKFHRREIFEFFVYEFMVAALARVLRKQKTCNLLLVLNQNDVLLRFFDSIGTIFLLAT